MSKESIKNVSFIIVGAGKSKRFKYHIKKIFYKINGKVPVFIFTIKNVLKTVKDSQVIFVYAKEDKKKIVKYLKDFKLYEKVLLQKGGEERAESVFNGISVAKYDTIFIHDCARPFLSHQLLISLYKHFTTKYLPVVPYINPVETVRMKNKKRVERIERSKVMLIQTPQVFSKSQYYEILKKSISKKIFLTDDAEYFLKEGKKVLFVEGDKRNIKITHRDDVELVESIKKRWKDDENRNRN